MGLVQNGLYIGHHESTFDTFKFPHAARIKEKTSVDVPRLAYYILGTQLLRIDASIVIGNNVLKMTDLTHPTGRKRFAKDAPDSVLPMSGATSKLRTCSPVTKKEVSSALDELNMRRETSAADQIVVKGHLKRLVKSLDDVLAISNRSDRDWSYEFESPAERQRVIADWVNWLFAYKYKIQSTYSKEQIRQLLAD